MKLGNKFYTKLAYKEWALSLLRHGPRALWMPTTISIEVGTACDRRCAYCPQAYEERKQEIISAEVWNLFLNRLREWRWKGRVGIVGICEPSIVPNIDGMIWQLSRQGCFPFMFTNGARFDVIESCLMNGLTRCLLSRHEPVDQEWIESANSLKRRYPFRVKLVNLGYTRFGLWHDWAGGIPIGRKLLTCDTVLGMIINRHGKVGLCSQDYNFHHPVGDIRTAPLAEIWKSYADMRKKALLNQCPIPTCANCLDQSVLNQKA